MLPSRRSRAKTRPLKAAKRTWSAIFIGRWFHDRSAGADLKAAVISQFRVEFVQGSRGVLREWSVQISSLHERNHLRGQRRRG
jgi:hypothetical protein